MTQWKRPADMSAARTLMLECEAARDYEGAALAAITLADQCSGRDLEGSTAYERQAQVYATLHQAQMVVWVAENRQPAAFFP